MCMCLCKNKNCKNKKRYDDSFCSDRCTKQYYQVVNNPKKVKPFGYNEEKYNYE